MERAASTAAALVRLAGLRDDGRDDRRRRRARGRQRGRRSLAQRLVGHRSQRRGALAPRRPARHPPPEAARPPGCCWAVRWPSHSTRSAASTAPGRLSPCRVRPCPASCSRSGRVAGVVDAFLIPVGLCCWCSPTDGRPRPAGGAGGGSSASSRCSWSASPSSPPVSRSGPWTPRTTSESRPSSWRRAPAGHCRSRTPPVSGSCRRSGSPRRCCSSPSRSRCGATARPTRSSARRCAGSSRRSRVCRRRPPRTCPASSARCCWRPQPSPCRSRSRSPSCGTASTTSTSCSTRTLLYVVLSGAAVLAYAGIVAALSSVLPAGVRGALAAALIAVAVAPVRSWLQRWIDRLLRGQRSDPYAMVSSLAERLEQADDLMDEVVRTIARAFRSPYVRMEVTQPGGLASCGGVRPPPAGHRLPALLPGGPRRLAPGHARAG